MLKRKTLKIFLVLLFMASASAGAVAPKYPAIKEFHGQVWLTNKDGKRLSLRQKQVLREKAVLETGPESAVRLQLDEKRFITLEASGRLPYPSSAGKVARLRH